MQMSQAKVLLDALALDPAVISKMLNRELYPAVPERAGMLKIDIFPARWSDLSRHYSCPDWAVPCKHLAAVIYRISRGLAGSITSTCNDGAGCHASVLPANHVLFQQNYFRARIQFRSATPNGDLV